MVLDRSERSVGRARGFVEPSVESAENPDQLEMLAQENERLRQRVTDLELTVIEYRRQMTGVLRSVSWRVTSPLRILSARYRAVKVRTRRALKRWVDRSGKRVGLRSHGVFAPDPESLPAGSPLLRFGGLVKQRSVVDAGLVSAIAPSSRVLVVAHVHYPELWGDIDQRLGRIHEPFDLVVTVTQGVAESAIPVIARRHRTARIEIVPNRGRDWGPLAHLVRIGAIGNYQAVVKMHTKKSEHRIDGDSWRLDLLDGVLESPEAIRRIVDLLGADSSVGMVVPTGHVVGTEHWGSNLGIIEALASRAAMGFDPESLKFAAGSMFWCRPWLLQQLGLFDLVEADFDVEGGQYDGTTAHALERLMGIMTEVGGMDIVEAMDVSARLRAIEKSPAQMPRKLAFYLPQYHQDPDNDEFWGEGFTEWHNVRKAQPLFPGHQQPLTPPDHVGFYDLADTSELERQAAQVRAAGLEGLIFYYYWFDGKAVLRKPLENLLANPGIDLPFALCWANEPWTRTWDGLDSDVLIPLALKRGWASSFYADIRSALFDHRYITIKDRPLVMIYRLDLIPDLPGAIATLRHLAKEDGFMDLHVLGVLPSRDFGTVAGESLACLDGLVSFPPGSAVNVQSIKDLLPHGSAGLGGDVYSYDRACDFVVPEAPAGYAGPIHPTVFPGWDNTARRGSDAYVFHGSNPLAFRRWLTAAAEFAVSQSPSLLFINAWNEWAEGAAIEGTVLPDQFAPRSQQGLT